MYIDGNYSNLSLKQKIFHLAGKLLLHNMAASSGLRENVYLINFSLKMFIFILFLLLLFISTDVKSYEMLLLLLGTDGKTYFRCYFIFILLLMITSLFYFIEPLYAQVL